ncbi:hypothetical protein [Larkinella rosea]|uniref:Uncharacterized protein n=1 Tax=Larkinella rosea TaxID=2025312 RepID=A0A3P1BRJ2_9BACT|nr:hypothetical protein [Larkinella rosea]RRB03691.1 hypothetical protein EHT25_09125 [Larkinella rosea]
MITTTEKVYQRVRQFWNDEYELNPGHRIIQSVAMPSDDEVTVELPDFRFSIAIENDQLIMSLGLIPEVDAPSKEEMEKTVVHVAELLKNLTGDLPVKVIQP